MTTCLNAKLEEVRSAGKAFYVPSVVICGRTVVVTGKRIRMAQVKDEEVVEGVTVAAPETFIAKLKESELKADVFTFAQRPPEITPKYGYHLEWENWAVAPTTSFNKWWDKRLMNALIAKAVELCQEKGISQLVYGRFVYGNNRQGSFVEFKRRNGFEQVKFPRYYVPLSLRGKVFVNLRLYRGLNGLIPEPFLQPLLRFRTWYCKAISTKSTLQRRNLPV